MENKKEVIGSTRFYDLVGDISTPYEIELSTLVKLVGMIKYPNKEHKHNSKKGLRCVHAIETIISSLPSKISGIELFELVSTFEGQSLVARIYPLGYNRSTGKVNKDRILRSKNAFFKFWCVLNGSYTEVKKGL